MHECGASKGDGDEHQAEEEGAREGAGGRGNEGLLTEEEDLGGSGVSDWLSNDWGHNHCLICNHRGHGGDGLDWGYRCDRFNWGDGGHWSNWGRCDDNVGGDIALAGGQASSLGINGEGGSRASVDADGVALELSDGLLKLLIESLLLAENSHLVVIKSLVDIGLHALAH